MEKELIEKFTLFDDGQINNLGGFTSGDIVLDLQDGKKGTWFSLAVENNKFLSALYILKNDELLKPDSIVKADYNTKQTYTLEEVFNDSVSNYDIDMIKLEIENSTDQKEIDHLKNNLAVELASIDEIKKLIEMKKSIKK